MKATAVANSNIALTKYWGKRDPELMLPQNGSVSMTLDKMFTRTTAEFGGEKDVLILNSEEQSGKVFEKTKKPIELIREKAGITDKVKIVSENNFPTAAGLASSASGFAALALAASKAAGLDLDRRELSILARRGSGSASRSVEGGFVEWLRGEAADGSDSYAQQIVPKDHWTEFRMIVAVTSRAEKKIKSRAGMAQTVETCPLYDGWLRSVDEDIAAAKKAILEKDFTALGETAEHNALKMHATMLATRPAIIYWTPGTMEVIHAVRQWREEVESYFTIDGGPQVKIISLEKDVPEISKRLGELDGVEDVIVCRPGDAARLVDDHLF